MGGETGDATKCCGAEEDAPNYFGDDFGLADPGEGPAEEAGEDYDYTALEAEYGQRGAKEVGDGA